MWWGRRRARLIEREVDAKLALVRHQMGEDAMGLRGRWRELDRLDAEIERRRMSSKPSGASAND